MSTHGKEDINDILNNVIKDINRITDHLRSHGENEAANKFSKEFTSTFQDLYTTIAPWNFDQCLVNPQESVENSRDQGTPPPLPTPSTTWATIAATAPADGTKSVIKYQPSEVVQQYVEVEERDRISRDRRVVWIQPWEQDWSLKEISHVMREVGPVYSMAYAPNEAGVCIVFQKAESAMKFLDICATYDNKNGHSPFGPDVSVIPGMPYAADADIRRMDAPENARRRLTFARQQLFCHGVNEKQFRKDIEDIVGARNIELLWLFNTGNATVVLSAVPLAKLVKDKFLASARKKGSPYEGVMVSYSHDPCERELRLVSQIPGHINYIGENGHTPKLVHASNGIPYTGRNRAASRTSQPRGLLSYSDTDRSTANRRDIHSMKPGAEDGWQTVQKKR